MPVVHVTVFFSNVESFCNKNMPDRCVVKGCSNILNTETGVALHKIPFYCDDLNKTKARRKKWTEFEVCKVSPIASSAVSSCHFSPRDFTRQISFGTQKRQRTLCQGCNRYCSCTKISVKHI